MVMSSVSFPSTNISLPMSYDLNLHLLLALQGLPQSCSLLQPSLPLGFYPQISLAEQPVIKNEYSPSPEPFAAGTSRSSPVSPDVVVTESQGNAWKSSNASTVTSTSIPMSDSFPSTRSATSSPDSDSASSSRKAKRGRPQQKIDDRLDDPNSQKRKHRRMYARQYRAQMRQKIDDVKSMSSELESLRKELQQRHDELARAQNEIQHLNGIISLFISQQKN